MPTSSISIKALALGFVVFPIAYVAQTLILRLTLDRPSDDSGMARVLMTAFSLIMYLGPGFVTGYLAERSALKHGVLLGALLVAGLVLAAVLSHVAAPYFIGPLSGLPWDIVIGFAVPAFIGSCIAAPLGGLFARRMRR